ncbi:MAG TPA: CAP domain-containing protein, partial [Nitratifractor sp.]|nr:CAP domain-containing protein [Nitratifractor sp.]
MYPIYGYIGVKMKTKILILLSAVAFLGGCQVDEIGDSYSSERASLSSVNVDLQKDIDDDKVCEWTAAHNQEEKFLALINYVRTLPVNCGDVQGPTTILTWNGSLYSAAKEHSEDMAQNNYVSNTGSGTATDITAYNLGLTTGSSPKQRANSYDYKESIVYENVAKTLASNGEVSDDDIVTTVENLLKDK